MRNEPDRQGDRPIEFVMGRLLGFAKQSLRSVRLTELGGMRIIGLMEFFFIFLSLDVVYSVLSARAA